MKKIGEYTARGKLHSVGGSGVHPITINLFEGKFDTGYRITEFVVGPFDVDNSSNTVFKAKLMTVDSGSALEWNWGDQTEVAWSFFSFDENSIHQNSWSLVDVDNLIVEDLYVYLEETANLDGNYYIKMDKYDISEFDGALALVRNASQDV